MKGRVEMLERAYLTFSISAPAQAEGITFQCSVAISEEGAKRLRVGIRTVRELHGFPVLRVWEHGLPERLAWQKGEAA